MKVTASLNYLRVSPRKVRTVVDVVRGMRADEAMLQLSYANKRAAEPVAKLLKSAIANAEHNMMLDKNTLTISSIKVNEGPALKRYMTRAQGRASLIKRKTSHVTVVLEGERMKEAPKKKKESKTEVITTDNASETQVKDTASAEPREKTLRETEKKLGERKKESFTKKIFRRKSI